MAPKQAPEGRSGKPSRPQNSAVVPSGIHSTASGQLNKGKRGHQGSNSMSNPRAAKRTKIYESRSIAVQSPHAALQDGELNVQSFVNSMAFEIKALDDSMRRSRASGSSRAFQRVPFTMRRRTAAHNYKRIPKRLHRRAKREMAEDNTPTVNSRTRKPKTSRARLRAETARRLGILAKRKRLLKAKKGLGPGSNSIATRAARPKIRRNEPNDLPVTAPRYRKRQLKKTWLPTHVWHAKRARITPPSDPLWGFSIPMTPTQKNYRPTHRAQWEEGAICWDMSYISTIGLFGKEHIIQNMLKDIGLTQESLWNDRGARWRAGAVHWTGTPSRKVKGTSRFIGPATIIWNPAEPSENPEAEAASRQIFIRIHPSMFFEIFNELLRLVRAYKPRPYIQDLRHEIGSIDITGPEATEALHGVLKAHGSGPKESQFLKFESLLGLTNPASLPLGALLAFSIADPRLKYPPQKVQVPDAANRQVQIRLIESINKFRKDDATRPYQLFDRDARFIASTLPSQKSVNRRRGRTGPGITLEPSTVDPPIPIMLIASQCANEKRIPGTWTILLPWKCVKSVWHSLMHCPLSTGGNPMFGGLDEIRQLAFERSQPWFPGDFPGTDAGNAWELKERQVRKKTWDRKPKGKRVQWESLNLGAGRKGEVGVGWNCDFETLFNFQAPVEAEKALTNEGGEDHEMSGTQEPIDPRRKESVKRPCPDTASQSLTDVYYLPKKTFDTHLLTYPTNPLPPNSVITVSIRMLGRGIVTTCARIYRLPNTTPAQSSPSTSSIPSSADVPTTTTDPPPEPSAQTSILPIDLKAQWLAQNPSKTRIKSKSRTNNNNNKNQLLSTTTTTITTPESRRQALAQSLLGPQSTHPHPPHVTTTSRTMAQGRATDPQDHHHPLCPDASDLMGFVTTGSFNLRVGRGEALGALSAARAAREIRRYPNPRDPAAGLCVVRGAGQAVGWLARWELCETR